MANLRNSTSQDKFFFRPPPECPVFTPTWEQFKDPMEFFGCISHIGIKTGIVKIIPPKGWSPPFAVDIEKFRFTPRIQRLYELEAQSRIKLKFISRLYEFHKLHKGQPLKIPCISGNYLDLYKLHKLVSENGSFQIICENRKWGHITEMLGYPARLSSQIKSYYEKILLAFDMIVEGNNKKAKDSQSPGKLVNRKRATVVNDFYEDDSRNTRVDEKSQMNPYACKICKSEEDDTHLLICDNEICQSCYHIQCLTPPLTTVPNFSWKCPDCVREACNKSYGTYGFQQSVKSYSLDEFGNHADNFKASYFNCRPDLVPLEMVEQEFWRILQEYNDDVIVEYGADIHSIHQGSGFPTELQLKNEVDPNYKGKRIFLDRGEEHFENAMKYARSPWNLNNLPVLSKSILRFIQGDISGMKVPWCYVGMVFSSFCWHIEDHWSYSINYNHWGEPKTWYGVPSLFADKFEDAMRRQASELFDESPDLLHHITTIMNPNILEDEGVPVYKANQFPGEFVLTFPRSYHAGFNQGFNFAEAVNFCLPDWLPMGRCSVNDYVTMRRQCVFSHQQLVWVLAQVATNKITFADVKSTIPPTVAGSIDFQAGLDPVAIEIIRQELDFVIKDEIEGQKVCDHLGDIKRRQISFEEFTDDERSCVKCQTTLFFSALACNCCKKDELVIEEDDSPKRLKLDANLDLKARFCQSRKVCLEHINDLCNSCDPTSYTLFYSHTQEEMIKILNQAKKTIDKQNENNAKMMEMLKKFNDCHMKKRNSIQEIQADSSTLAEFSECINSWTENSQTKSDFLRLKKIYTEVSSQLEMAKLINDYLTTQTDADAFLRDLDESKRLIKFNIQKETNCKNEKKNETLKKISLLVPHEFPLDRVSLDDLQKLMDQLNSRCPPLNLDNEESYSKLGENIKIIELANEELLKTLGKLNLQNTLLAICDNINGDDVKKFMDTLKSLLTSSSQIARRVNIFEFDCIEKILGTLEQIRSDHGNVNHTIQSFIDGLVCSSKLKISMKSLCDKTFDPKFKRLHQLVTVVSSKVTSHNAMQLNRFDLVHLTINSLVEELSSDYHIKQHSNVKSWLDTLKKVKLSFLFESPMSLFDWDLIKNISQESKSPERPDERFENINNVIVNFDKLVNVWTTKARKSLNLRDNYTTYNQIRDLKLLGQYFFQSLKPPTNKEYQPALLKLSGEYERMISSILHIHENLSSDFDRVCALFDKRISHNMNARVKKSIPLLNMEQEIIFICHLPNGAQFFDNDIYQFMLAIDKQSSNAEALYEQWIKDYESYIDRIIKTPKTCSACQHRDEKMIVLNRDKYNIQCSTCQMLLLDKPNFTQLENVVNEIQSQSYFLKAVTFLQDYIKKLTLEFFHKISLNGVYISNVLEIQLTQIFHAYNSPMIRMDRAAAVIHNSEKDKPESDIHSFKTLIYTFYFKFALLPISAQLQNEVLKFISTNL